VNALQIDYHFYDIRMAFDGCLNDRTTVRNKKERTIEST
jgi:hypothetical protein